MTAGASFAGVAAHARVSDAGVLLAADSLLLDVQRQAGADIGDALAIPGLARLAVLAARLGQHIEKSVLIASPDADIRVTARVTPQGGAVAIALCDWQATPRAEPSMTAEELLSVAPTLVSWACDVRLRLVMVDAPAGIAPPNGSWVGMPLSQLFALHANAAGQTPLIDGLAAQSTFAGQPAQIVRQAGLAPWPVMLSAQPMLDGDAFTGFVGIARGEWPADVPGGAAGGATARATLGPAGRPTGLSAIDPRQFASRIDGAMRRPISRIIANAETIAGQLDGPIRSDYNRYARDIALAGRHLMDLVDDLADLQVVERPDFKVAREAVDLAEIGRRAAGLLSLKAREKSIQIAAPDADDRVLVTGEFRRVLQILLNLIGNAIAYGPEESQVWVCVGTDEENGWIVVADQGEGIATDAQERVFNKFERLGRSDAAGSGLGLYISRRLADAMHGTLTVDSAKGQGARFTLRLPLNTPA